MTIGPGPIMAGKRKYRVYRVFDASLIQYAHNMLVAEEVRLPRLSRLRPASKHPLYALKSRSVPAPDQVSRVVVGYIREIAVRPEGWRKQRVAQDAICLADRLALVTC